jgi:hypothetical protein
LTSRSTSSSLQPSTGAISCAVGSALSRPAVPGLDRDPGAPGEDVLDVPGALVRGGVDDLGPQEVRGALEWLPERWVSGDEREHLGDERAVPAEQVVDPATCSPLLAASRLRWFFSAW